MRKVIIQKSEIAIEVNEKDVSRCSIRCEHISKINGNYRCLLFNENVDTGDDDELGYGFQRTKECLKLANAGEE